MKKQEPTIEQKEQAIKLSGWLATFADVFGFIGRLFNVPLLDFVTCLTDRSSVKKYKGVSVPWGYCLIAPLYMYQRKKRLDEDNTKFVICLCTFIVLNGISVLSFLALMN